MDPWLQTEVLVNLFFQGLGAWLAPIMALISDLGTAYVYLVVFCVIYWCIDTALGLRIGLILMLSESLNGVIKILFHSPRPYWIDSRVKAYAGESTFGLPSGHSQNAASVYGLIASTLRRKWVWIAALALILLIGISRMYLGVHFLRDVLGGWLLGFMLLYLFRMLDEPVSKSFKQQKIWLRLSAALLSSLLIIAVGMLARIAVSDWVLPAAWSEAALKAVPGHPIDPFAYENVFTVAGVWFGMVAGLAFVVDGSGVHDPSGPVLDRLIRLLIGLIGLLALYIGLGRLLPDTRDFLGYCFRFARYALIGLWAVWLAPLVFLKFRLARPRKAV